MAAAEVKSGHNSPDWRQEKLPGSVSGSLRGCHLDMILMSPITLSCNTDPAPPPDHHHDRVPHVGTHDCSLR